MDNLVFDHGQRHFELIEAIGCFRLLVGFAEDKNALDAYMFGAGRPRRLMETGEALPVEDEAVEKFISSVSDSVEVALSTYRKQMIVVFVSITEAAIAEAFRVLFHHQPELIKALAADSGAEEFRAAVSLDQLIAAKSLKELHASIVERAVGAACQGKSKQTVLRRLGRLYGRPIAREVGEQYIDLCNQRNSIVHEHQRIGLYDRDVEKACDSAISLLGELGHLVRNKSLPLHDPIGISGG